MNMFEYWKNKANVTRRYFISLEFSISPTVMQKGLAKDISVAISENDNGTLGATTTPQIVGPSTLLFGLKDIAQ
jgi:hypothetical protein